MEMFWYVKKCLRCLKVGWCVLGAFGDALGYFECI